MRRLVALVALTTGAALYLAWLKQPCQVDDSMIYLRYARNLLEGRGWVYNPGEWVDGATSTGNTLLLTLASWLSGGRYELAQVLLFGLGVGATGTFTFLLFSARGWVAAIVACACVMSLPYLYWLIGMDAPLILGFATAATWCYTRRRFKLCAILLAALCLTRGDGVVLATTICVHYLWTQPKSQWREFGFALLLFVVPLLTWATISWSLFGSFVPKTLGAKLAQTESGLHGEGWIFVKNVVGQLGNFANIRLDKPWNTVWQVGFISLGAVGSAVALARRHPCWPLVVFGLGQSTLYAVLNLPNYLWYYIPLNLTLTLGIAVIVEVLWHQRAVARTVAACLVIGYLYPVAPSPIVVRDANALHYKSVSYYPHYASLAKSLRERFPEGASIACAEIGVLGYELENWRIIDMWGLVTKGGVDAMSRGDFAWWFRETEPDFVLFHNPFWRGPELAVASLTDFHAKYELFEERSHPDPLKRLLLMRRKKK